MKKDKTIKEMAKEHAEKLINEMGEFNAFVESWKQIDHWTYYDQNSVLRIFWSEVKDQILMK